ncbi:ATP-grasp domain-containing protein [Massilia pseudoviolaceinigra]|uniref:ATP-grasp domain-containing protein n=1 Tax=Massilia pseudoviolaceinigra TaxID=3057165 RepID=UPI0027964B24|nr:ATP-grasp domain-containing protein [Massilia sp. CCM 9206]MDQ1921900.1 ATP-grasp domain-containing protein [Massilia sp. CCM 9206]
MSDVRPAPSTQLLFPCDPLNRRVADEAYAEEFDAARAAGFACSLFSFEDFEAGQFKTQPALCGGVKVLYRGWMLTPDSYARLHDATAEHGCAMATSPTQYRHCHYLPEWYALCKEFTPETVIVARDADFAAAVDGRNWPAYFVKDYVKSLTTQRGSVAATPQEIADVVGLIETYRGAVEGGVCIRKFEQLQADSEERYFVLHGQAHGRDGSAPELVHEIARRIESPFFSVDVVASSRGELRLIELGDGQVSDRKQWPVGRFMAMLDGTQG